MAEATVISRIHKLMALTTDRGATEHEAAIAAEHVQRLLAEHNLSMATIEASGQSSGDGGKRVKQEGVGGKQVYKWQQSLMKAIGKLNYCHVTPLFKERREFDERKCVTRATKVFDGYEIIGRVDNVATTRVMFEYLLSAIERAARDDVNNDPSQFFTRYAHSFKEGCADRLRVRLGAKHQEIIDEQERRAREQQARGQHPGAAPSNLPAVLMSDMIQNEKDLNNDLLYGYEPGTTARQHREWEDQSRKNQERRDAREKELVVAGYPSKVAYYIALGYDEQRAYQLAFPKPDKPETDAQRRKREQREERYDERYWSRYQKEASRLDQEGYTRGDRAGETIGLDAQLDTGKQHKLKGQ